MGSCVSTPNRRSGSRKFYSRSKKSCGKISALVPDEPATWKTDKGNHSSFIESDQFENVTSTRRRAEVSNLTAHLTQLQWHRVRDVSCALSEAEDWFDYANVLESDSDDDDDHIHLAVTNSPLDAPCKSEKLGNCTLVSLAVQSSTKVNQDKTETLPSKDGHGPGEGIQTMNLGDSEIAFQEVDGVKLTDDDEQVGTRTSFSEDTSTNIRHGTEGKNHESISKELKPPCNSSSVFSINRNDNILPNPADSEQRHDLKLAVYKRKSKDYEASKICAPRSYLCSPKTGLPILSLTEEKTLEELWCILEPSFLKLYGPSYFRNKSCFSPPSHLPDTPIGVDAFLSHCHIAQNTEFPSGANLVVILLADNVGERVSHVLCFDNEASLQFQNKLRKIFNNTTESLEDLVTVLTISDSERQKFVAKFNKSEDPPPNETEKERVNDSSENPLVSQPRHTFYQAQIFSENNHRTLESVLQQLMPGILSFQLIIQEPKPEE